jgi:hypothetical protein
MKKKEFFILKIQKITANFRFGFFNRKKSVFSYDFGFSLKNRKLAIFDFLLGCTISYAVFFKFSFPSALQRFETVLNEQ